MQHSPGESVTHKLQVRRCGGSSWEWARACPVLLGGRVWLLGCRESGTRVLPAPLFTHVCRVSEQCTTALTTVVLLRPSNWCMQHV